MTVEEQARLGRKLLAYFAGGDVMLEILADQYGDGVPRDWSDIASRIGVDSPDTARSRARRARANLIDADAWPSTWR